MARAFRRHPNPWVIAIALAIAAGIRIHAGHLNRWDAIVAASFVAAQPFTEWCTHIGLLHARPKHLLGFTIDPHAAKRHRAHHADPRNPKLVFVPLRVLVGMIIGGALIYWLVFPTVALAATAMTVSMALLSVYEWVHFLIHSPYLPASRLYRHIWRAHRRHHFRNEHYWFGITVHFADHLFGTFPDKDAIPPSLTCRTLGIDAP